MSVDKGMLIAVTILAVVGSIVGLVLSIVLRVVNGLWRQPPTSVKRAMHAVYVTAYVGIGVWAHQAMGVGYARARASYAQESPDCMFCAPIDGRHGWIFLWVVAGLVAYALRPQRRSRSAGPRLPNRSDQHG
jgi:hypothetical protein